MTNNIKLIGNKIYFERLTIDLEIDKNTFMQEAAIAIANELLANGCLVHNSEYNIASGKYHEVIHIFVGKKGNDATMLALDLFCGAGGASKGIANVGFEVIGVDNTPGLNYPYEYYCEDAVEFMALGLDDFDFIWASPPCQAYSWSSACRRNEGVDYQDLVEITRYYLQASGKPYIIENVVGAPLINPVVLCGTMFPDLKVFRHRLFESNVPLIVEMECAHEGHKAKERRDDNGDFFTVAGNWCGTLRERSDAMGIDWMTRKELNQAIPPAYSEYLVRQIKDKI